MEAIVLAGGLGTRLRAVITDLPKPMAPINGRPFLEILLESLARKGFTRAILSIGYLAEKISNHFGAHFAGLDLLYCVEQSPLGTGGAVRKAIDYCSSDHVFVFNGDTFLDLEVDKVELQWKSHHHPIIVGRDVPDASRYGHLIVKNKQVVGFTEKGASGSGIINAGCYVFSKNQLNIFPLNSYFSLEKDFLEKYVDLIPFDIFLTQGQFIDIGIPEDFQRAQKILL